MTLKADSKKGSPRVVELVVAGFKSIRDRTAIELRPITILAGANSSGKSSFMQPLLMLKQTLEQPFDAGPLSLEGANVHFSKCEQLFWHTARKTAGSMEFGFRDSQGWSASESLDIVNNGIHVAGFQVLDGGKEYKYHEGQQINDVGMLPPRGQLGPKTLQRFVAKTAKDKEHVSAGMTFQVKQGKALPLITSVSSNDLLDDLSWEPFSMLQRLALETIHLPGLRGNPSRSYRFTTITGKRYPGVFQDYFASLVCRWTESGDEEKLQQLSEHLRRLELTSLARAKRATDNDVAVEVQVGRTLRKHASEQDLVSVADTGLGLSQTLPWLVALLAARNQLVYIEQPEIHLHPRAQYVIGQILAQYADSGITMVVETHSALVLLGLQTLVAQGKLSREKVGLNWFRRDAGSGATHVETASLDDLGRTGKWSYDLTEIMTTAERAYVEASLSADARKKNG